MSFRTSAFVTHVLVTNGRPRHFSDMDMRRKSLTMASLRPSRVAIAGAGIAGLATAITLLKTQNTGVESVTIFEPRENADVGMGAALNINGAAAILLQYGVPLWDIGNPMKSVTARTSDGSELFNVNIDQALAMSTQAKDSLTFQNRPTFMTVMRDQLQAILLEQLHQMVEIHRGRSNLVTKVEESTDGGRFVLADGSKTDEYDLLIGADGLRSNVRKFVAGRSTTPEYTQLRVQWAIAAPGPVDLPSGEVEQWFGDGCYVLRYVGGCFPDTVEMLALSFQDKARSNENASYTEDNIREDVGRRLARAGMPKEVMRVFERAERFIETGVYQHEVLETWNSQGGRCTLVGDAGK